MYLIISVGFPFIFFQYFFIYYYLNEYLFRLALHICCRVSKGGSDISVGCHISECLGLFPSAQIAHALIRCAGYVFAELDVVFIKA